MHMRVCCVSCVVCVGVGRLMGVRPEILFVFVSLYWVCFPFWRIRLTSTLYARTRTRARPAATPRGAAAGPRGRRGTPHRREPAEAPESSSRGNASRESPIIDTQNVQERKKLN